MWFALSSLSHTRIERSQAPENSTDPSSFRAKAFTADLCFSRVATNTWRFSPNGLAHTRIRQSADPVYTVPSFDTATAFTASSCALTDSTQRRSESRQIFRLLSQETERLWWMARQVMGREGRRGLRVAKQRWETERSRASRGESFWRETTDGSVWRERLLWRLLLLVSLALVLALGTSEVLLVSEVSSFVGDGDVSGLENGMVDLLLAEQMASQDRTLMASSVIEKLSRTMYMILDFGVWGAAWGPSTGQYASVDDKEEAGFGLLFFVGGAGEEDAKGRNLAFLFNQVGLGLSYACLSSDHDHAIDSEKFRQDCFIKGCLKHCVERKSLCKKKQSHDYLGNAAKVQSISRKNYIDNCQDPFSIYTKIRSRHIVVLFAEI
ncbi:unnamed protein product [Malus baccata var. baccata]